MNSNCLIDFDKFHTALRDVNLLNCQGSIVRVSGQRIESTGPSVGLGELCVIHIRDGRRVLAEVVGFHNDHLILLPLEHINGISPGDTVTCPADTVTWSSVITIPQDVTLAGNGIGNTVISGNGAKLSANSRLTGFEFASNVDTEVVNSAQGWRIDNNKFQQSSSSGFIAIKLGMYFLKPTT